MVNVCDVYDSRRAVSSGEPSLSGSLDDERGTLSDSEVLNAIKLDKLSRQVKGPSSDALEKNCIREKIDALTITDLNEKTFEQNVLTDEWIDVLGSGDLLRKILRLGDGNCPKVGDWITINSTCLTSNADTFTSYRFVLGFHFVVESWDIIFQLMQKGEKCHIKCDARFAYGNLGLQDLIAKNQSQEYVIELVDIHESFLTYSETANLKDPDVVAFLLKIKERANFFYRREEIEKSLFLYKKGVELFNRQNIDSVLLRQLKSNELKVLIAQFYSNISACHYKLKDWEKVVEFAKKSLRFNESSGKVWCRQAEALCHKHRYAEALKCLENAIDIDSSNEMAKRQILVVQDQLENQKAKEKRVYQRMFNGIGKAADSSNDKMAASNNPLRKYSWRRWIIIAISIAILAFVIHFIRRRLFY